MSGVNVGSVYMSAFIKQNLFTKGLKSMENKAALSFKKMAAGLAAAFSVKVLVDFGKESVKVANETKNAWMGLESIATGQGRSFSKAQKAVRDYVKDGLVPLQDAVNAYKNLAARGFDDKQITDIMNRLKDAAAFGRQSSYTLGGAISSATEGLKNENSVLVDNAGVTKNVAKMWDEYAKSIGKVRNNLTDAEKRQAEYIGIMKETRFQVGDAAKLTETFSGKVSRLSATWTNIKTNIGDALTVALNRIVPVIQRVADAFERATAAAARFIELVFGKVVKGATGAISDVADIGHESSEALEGMGSAAESAAKKAKRALAGFDEINSLAFQQDTGGSGGSGSGAETESGITFEDASESLFESNSLLDSFKDKIEALKIVFEPTIEAFNRLKDALSQIKDFALTGLQDFYKNFLVPVGNWVLGKEGLPRLFDILTSIVNGINWQGLNQSLAAFWAALAPFAMKIGEGLLDFLEYVLKPLALWTANEAIPTFLAGLTRILTNVDWENIRLKMINLYEAIANFAGTIGDGLLWFYENVLVPLVEWALNNIAPIVIDGLAAAFNLLNEVLIALQPLGIWLWESFLKPLAEWTGGIIVEVLQGIVDALNKVTDWIRNNQTLIETIATIVGSFAAAWALVTGAVKTFGAISAAAPVVIKAVGAAMGFLTGPVGIAVLAIGALIAATILLIRNWDTVKEVAQKVWDKIKEIWGAAADWFNENVIQRLMPFIETIKPLLEKTAEIFILVFGKIKSYILEWAPIIKDIIVNAVKLIIEVVKGFVSIVKSIIERDLTLIKTGIQNLLKNISDFWDKWGDTIIVIVGGILDILKAKVKFFADVIGSSITFLLETIKTVIKLALAIIKGDWDGAWQTLQEYFESFSKHMERLLEAFKTFIVDIFDGIKSTLIGIWDMLVQKLRESWEIFIGKIEDGLASFKEFFVGIFEGVKDSVLKAWDGLWTGIKGIINMIIGGINKMVGALNDLKINIPKVDIPLVGEVGGGTIGFNIPKIPMLAKGGIIDQPTLAMVGESGREAVVPLENNTGWMNKMSETIANAIISALSTGGSQQQSTAEAVIELDGTTLARLLVPYISDEFKRTGVKLV